MSQGQAYYFLALWLSQSASVTSAAGPVCLASRFSSVVSSSSSWSLPCSWSVVQKREENINKAQITKEKDFVPVLINSSLFTWLPLRLLYKSNYEAAYNFHCNFGATLRRTVSVFCAIWLPEFNAETSDRDGDIIHSVTRCYTINMILKLLFKAKTWHNVALIIL